MKPGACACCLGAHEGGAHANCLRELFGRARFPEIDVDVARLQTLALATVGRHSMSGVQRKLSLQASADGRRLQVAVDEAAYILKPQSRTWSALPELEHCCMALAAAAGLDVPPRALVTLKDGTTAYLVRRFDRTASGGKRACEDFCQLAQLPPKEKYDGTAEQCASLLRRYATDPGIEALALFRRLLFAWWIGDGDAHLKNLSLLRDETGWRLSPAYDCVATELLIPDGDGMALPVSGTRCPGRTDWLAFARTSALPERVALRALADQSRALPAARALVRRSFLPADYKRDLEHLLERRTALIAAALS